MTIRRLGFLVGAAALSVGTAVWYLDGDRSLKRSWRDLVGTVENRRALALRDQLAPDYADRWGYDRDTLVLEMQIALRAFESLRVRPEQVEFRRTGDDATVSAVIRIEAHGPPSVDDARSAVNGIFTPFVFSWRREPDFPWSWKLTRTEQPDFHPERYRRGARGYF